MIINNSGVTGSLSMSDNNGFKQTLAKLSETFESTQNLDYVSDLTRIMKHKNLSETYMSVILEDYADASTLSESTTETNEVASYMATQNNAKLRQLMENSRTALLNEAQMSGELKPIVGLTMPLLKLYWVKNVFKDFISTEVAEDYVIKRAIERQYVEDPNGKRYWLPEAFTDPDVDLFKAARTPLNTEDIPVPSQGYDLITKAGGSLKNDDQISPLFFINSITYKKQTNEDNLNPTYESTKVTKRIKVDAGTGMFREPIYNDKNELVDIVMGDVDFTTGLLNVASTKGLVQKITVDGALSSENHLNTLSVGWDKENIEFHIPEGIHISTGLTEERIKREKIMYNQDTQAKILSQMNDTLAQIKDTNIKKFLEDSAARIKGTDLFVGSTFDCKPPEALGNITNTEWSRTELKETLDRVALDLVAILQNENVRLSVLGHPKDIRLLDNVQWMYGKDSEVGGCKLGYSIGLYNNQRNFLIGSSYKIQPGTLRIILTPLGDDQITYKLFEFQFFISNQYRDPKNLRVPSIMASDAYLIDEVIPVQSEIEIKNNLNSSSEIFQAGH